MTTKMHISLPLKTKKTKLKKLFLPANKIKIANGSTLDLKNLDRIVNIKLQHLYAEKVFKLMCDFREILDDADDYRYSGAFYKVSHKEPAELKSLKSIKHENGKPEWELFYNKNGNLDKVEKYDSAGNRIFSFYLGRTPHW